MSFVCFVATTFLAVLSHASLPGKTKYGMLKVDVGIDLDANNNCEWEESEPLTNTSVYPFGNFAAVDTDFFNDAVACGECYKITCNSKIDSWGGCDCTSGDVTVMIVDYGQDVTNYYNMTFDVEPGTAANIMSGSCDADGSKYNITYTQVCCDHLNDIQVYNTEYMTDQWLSFIVTNVRGYGSIEHFYMREPGRTDYWECNRNTNGGNKNWVCDPWGEDYTDYLADGIADGIIPNETWFLNQGNSPSYNLPIDVMITDTRGNTLTSLDLITTFTINTKFNFGDNYDAVCDGNIATTDMTTTAATTDYTTSDFSSSSMSSTEYLMSTTDDSTSSTQYSTSSTEMEYNDTSTTMSGGTRGYTYVPCDDIIDRACSTGPTSGSANGDIPCCVQGDTGCVPADPHVGGDCRIMITTTADVNGGNRQFNVQIYQILFFSVAFILEAQFV